MKHFRFLFNYWPMFLVTFGTGLIISFLEGLGITFIFPLFDAGTGNTASQLAFPFNAIIEFFNGIPLLKRMQILALWLVVITLIKGLMMYINALYSSRLLAIAVTHFRMNCFKQLMYVGMGYFNKQKGADFQTICYTNTTNLGTVVSYIGRAMPMVFSIIVLLMMIFLLSWKMALISLVLAGSVSWILKRLSYQSKISGQGFNTAVKRVNSALLESIMGMKIIRLFNREDNTIGNFEREVEGLSKSQIEMAQVKVAVQPIFEFVSVTCLAVIMIAGSFFLFGDTRGEGFQTLVVFIVIFSRIASPIMNLNRFRIDITGDISTYKDVFRFLDLDDKKHLKNGTVIFKALKEKIEFKNIKFRYESEKPLVLSGISFAIMKGSRVGIVGVSGVGKSTIVELLLHFYDPQEGQVLVDGIDLRDFDVNSWRKKIGVVSQDTFLFNDTIRANIAFGKSEASLQDIEKSAGRSHAHEFIRHLPLGYDTAIGDRGVLLSGGQRQRIAIARAIINDPEILIFDEATSALDSESEKIVQQALNDVGEGKTVVVIAHRLSTVLDCDYILVMESGNIVQQGTHEDLLKGEGIYRKFVQMQELKLSSNYP